MPSSPLPSPGAGGLRVACFTLPITGHVTPLLPVIAELAVAGASVQVAASAALAPRFRAAGAQSVTSYPPAFSAAVQQPSDNFIEVAALLARWTADALLDAAGALLDAEQPDVVVVDSMAPWGRLAAERRGIPVATSTSSFLIDARLGASPRAALDILRRLGPAAGSLVSIARTRIGLRRDHGVDCGGPLSLLSNRGDATLVYTSRALQPAGGRFPADVHFVGPTACERDAPAPIPGSPLAALLSDDRRPLAYVSLGTVYWDRPAFLRDAAHALEGLGFRTVIALGEGLTADALGPLPAHAIAVRDAPQLAILDEASLFVTHGGVNSVHEALWRRVPMVVFPQAADQPVVGARLQQLGAARMLRGVSPGPAAIAVAARQVMDGPAGQVAAALGTGLRATGGAPTAAGIIRRTAG